MAIRTDQQTWGPPQTSRKYRLLMADAVYPNLIALDCGWGLGAPTFDESAAVVAQRNCYTRSGEVVAITETIETEQIRQTNIDLMLPEAYTLWTPIDAVAGRNCTRDFFMCYICAQDSDQAHFYHLPKGRLGEIKEDSVYIEGRGDGVPWTAASTLHYYRKLKNYALLVNEMQTAPAAMHAIAFDFAQCANCDPNQHRRGFYGGIDALYYSDDGFASGVSVTLPGFVVGDRVTGIYAEGGVVIVTAEVNIVIAPAVGAIYLSVDNGATFAAVTPATPPAAFEDVIRGGGYYYVCGTAGTVYRSLDGSTWELITNTVSPTTDFLKMAYDERTSTVYLAGSIVAVGTALTLKGNAFANISTLVFGGTTPALRTVSVLGPGHVAYGGAGGFFSENHDVSGGDEFSRATIGSGQINAILGGSWNTTLSTGTKIYNRRPCTGMTWALLDLAVGITVAGVILGGADGLYDRGVNDMAMVTASGEVLRIAAQYPGSI